MSSSDNSAMADGHVLDNAFERQGGDDTAPLRQVAALVWQQGGGGVEVLLVTSRISGHWLLPKGWPIEGMPAVGAAMQEAYEEAGAWGDSGDDPIGTYDYQKVRENGTSFPCSVDVFAIEAQGLMDDWPERTQRRRRWFTLPSAAARVMEPDLGRFLRQCGGLMGTDIEQPPPTALLATGMAGRRTREPTHHATEQNVITAAQCRAARGLVDWTIDRLAEDTGILVADLSTFEQGGELDPRYVDLIAASLENAGAKFLTESRGRGAGVRLKFTQQTVKRIDIWENEGGPTDEDDAR